jgi:hypothetical protein
LKLSKLSASARSFHNFTQRTIVVERDKGGKRREIPAGMAENLQCGGSDAALDSLGF